MRSFIILYKIIRSKLILSFSGISKFSALGLSRYVMLVTPGRYLLFHKTPLDFLDSINISSRMWIQNRCEFKIIFIANPSKGYLLKFKMTVNCNFAHVLTILLIDIVKPRSLRNI